MCKSLDQVNEERDLELAEDMIEAGKAANDDTKIALGQTIRAFIGMKHDQEAMRSKLMKQVAELTTQVTTLQNQVKSLQQQLTDAKKPKIVVGKFTMTHIWLFVLAASLILNLLQAGFDPLKLFKLFGL